MGSTISSVFKHPIIGGARSKTDARAAAQGFSAIFGSMLAKEMRESLGSSGLGNASAGGQVYGALFDESMGKKLAGSAAMKPLNELLYRQLGGAREPAAAGGLKQAGLAGRTGGLHDTALFKSGTLETPQSMETETPSYPSGSNRGPILMPPAPDSMAPILPPPSPLEG